MVQEDGGERMAVSSAALAKTPFSGVRLRYSQAHIKSDAGRTAVPPATNLDETMSPEEFKSAWSHLSVADKSRPTRTSAAP